MALTGQYQFRKTFGGKVVLQVEEEVPTFWSWFGKHRTRKRWRDATLMDLSFPPSAYSWTGGSSRIV